MINFCCLGTDERRINFIIYRILQGLATPNKIRAKLNSNKTTVGKQSFYSEVPDNILNKLNFLNIFLNKHFLNLLL